MSDADSDAETYPRATVEPQDDRGRLRRWWDTLQDTATQPVESVTRTATFQSTGGDVEDVDPPEDIDELYALYEEIGLIRAAMNQFVSDVVEPGVRVQSEDQTTEDYFMGGDAAPDAAPEGGFLSECFVTDETRQPFEPGLKTTVLNRWVRGTILIERLKADPEDAASIITGFSHIRPETVSARTYENTIRLIEPDDTESADFVTPRDEAAAFVQFDERSILGRRDSRWAKDRESIPFSQNDVAKQTLDRNIGGGDPEDGVFGTSIIRAIKDDAEEYRSIKRDQAQAIKGKAWGIWTLQFNDYLIEGERHSEMVRWDDESIQNAEADIKSMGPGANFTTDAKIELERHDGDVPDLKDTLQHRVDDILAPLPAPKFTVGHETDINQFVVNGQNDRYQQVIDEERDYQERFWAAEFREVAERHDELDPEGLTVFIEPETDESPVMSLDTETVEKIETLSTALSNLVGQGESPAAVFGEDVVRSLVAQLPEETEAQETLARAVSNGHDDPDGLDESDEHVQRQFERLLPNDD